MDEKDWLTKLRSKLRRTHNVVILLPVFCSILLFTLFVGIDRRSVGSTPSFKGSNSDQGSMDSNNASSNELLNLDNVEPKAGEHIDVDSAFSAILNLSNVNLIDSFKGIPSRPDKEVKEGDHPHLGISEIKINNETRFISNEISVVIPASSSDWFLLPIVLDSILKQSVLPKEVIISYSNSENVSDYKSAVHPLKLFEFKSGSTQFNQNAADALLNASRHATKSLANNTEREKVIHDLLSILENYPDIMQLISHLPNVMVLNNHQPADAGTNREYGYKHCSGSIVAFFDSDDLMHPRRIETLHSAFRYHEIEALVHSFEYTYLNDYSEKYNQWLKGSEDDPEIGWNNVQKLPLEMRANDMFEHYDRSLDYEEADWKWYFADKKLIQHNPELYQRSYHNGWLTIRKSVLEKVDLPKSARGQDSRLIYRLLQEFDLKLGFLKSTLGLYVRPNGVKRRKYIEAWLGGTKVD